MPRRTTRRHTRRKRKGGVFSFEIQYGTTRVKGQELSKKETQIRPTIMLPKVTGTFVMWDPDAVNGYLHWMIRIKDGKVQEEIVPYEGPTPPSGIHQYRFEIYDTYPTPIKRTPFSMNGHPLVSKYMIVSA